MEDEGGVGFEFFPGAELGGAGLADGEGGGDFYQPEFLLDKAGGDFRVDLKTFGRQGEGFQRFSSVEPANRRVGAEAQRE